MCWLETCKALVLISETGYNVHAKLDVCCTAVITTENYQKELQKEPIICTVTA